MANNDLSICMKINSNTKGLVVSQNDVNKLAKGLYDVTQKAKGFTQSLAGITKVTGVVQGAKKAFDVMFSSFTNLINTSAEFEKFEVRLSAIEGSSSKAKDSMKWIQDFATQTPYKLNEVTEAFVKLKAYGINPTDGILKTLGDTASATGKPMMQAVEAMADALTGKNEKLEEFGIKVSSQNGKIAYSWMDASNNAKHMIIDNNEKIKQSTLSSIFNSKYKGAMQKQMSTYDGMISNMQNSWTIFKLQMMNAGAFDYIKALLQTILKVMKEVFNGGAEKSKVFANIIIAGVNKTIEAFGFLSDSIVGIKLVLKAIKFAFLAIVKYFSEAINRPITLLNKLIEGYNVLASKIHAKTINFHIDPLINTDGIDKELKSTWDSMGKDVDTLLHNSGQKFAKKFTVDVQNAFKKIKEQRSNNEKNKPKQLVKNAESGNVQLGSPSNKNLKNSYTASMNTLKKDYYVRRGDFQNAWNVSQERSNAHNKAVALGLKGEDFNQYIESYKKDFLKPLTKKSKKTGEDIKSIFTNAFSGMGKQLTNFVNTGKINFNDLINTIISGIVRLAIQKKIVDPITNNIINPLVNSFTNSSIFSSIFGLFQADGGLIPTKRYAIGGLLTGGSGIRDDLYLGSASGHHVFAMGGEYILNKNATQSIGVNTLNSMNKTGSVPNSNVLINIENKTTQNISAENMSQYTRTNSRGEQEKVINIVLDGVNRNINGIRDVLKATK